MGFFRRWSRAPSCPQVEGARRLHIGCGTEIIPGWTNIDIQDLPGVDIVLDITEGIPFSDVEYIYCEHFIEHLRFDQAFDFLADCFEGLEDGGVMRLSTPNLDWVYITHYSVVDLEESKRIANTFMLNRAFYGWGHQFLYNRELLVKVLEAVGFQNIVGCAYGVSTHPALNGLERHERYKSTPELSDIIVLEAGKAAGRRADKTSRRMILRQARAEFLDMLEWKIDGS